MNETRNNFIEEINQNESMNKKHQKVCTVLNYIRHLFILTSAFTECVSISAFTSFVGIIKDVGTAAVGLKVCAITKGIKNCKSMIK